MYTVCYDNRSVKVCLLGLIDPLAPTKAIHTLLTLLFYYARKIIILLWKKKNHGPLHEDLEGINK